MINAEALNFLVGNIHLNIANNKKNLEVEESGRKVTSLQGYIQGYREFIETVRETFGLELNEVEDDGDYPESVEKMDDESLKYLSLDCENLRITEEWKAIVETIESEAENIKYVLLYEADKVHDLDILQGRHRGMTAYIKLLDSVKNEISRRERVAEEDAKSPQLPFDVPETDEPLIDVPEIKIDDLP